MKNVDQNNERITTIVKVILSVLLIFIVIAIIPHQNLSYAQSDQENINLSGNKEPTLEDVYRLLEEIKAKLEEKERKLEIEGALTGIKITGWSFYVAWGVPFIHNVAIENNSDLTYTDIRIGANYYYSYSNDYGRSETGRVEGTLPITLPPHTKEVYFRKGMILQRATAASMYGGPKDIEIVGAIPVIKENLFSMKLSH